ncbi:putative nicotinamide mononucleotide permease [Dioszegia hungarica]|uniref:Nicotinamide mononucleotide permease n=1 Tax=Dioszegia hungarica TaxID=4972 RepID=A0AA38GZW5_9TREE|nr:putative nicotinamide mononucleotide permease [Dioszegia hungarica]KAI9632058.1 putative nicotinamide mononucleotide permease [Dioszegia hungarica]
MSRLDDEKYDADHASLAGEPGLGKTEHDDGVDRHLAITKPAILEGLSDEEIAAIDKRTTRKLDILLMPTLVCLYILNYLDRQNIASAKLAFIDVQLGMSAVQYQTAVAILFAGYVALQIPSNMIVSKIKWPGIYICGMCCAWGLVSGCTGAVTSYAGLVICRVILGFTEAAFFPGAIFLLSLFYEKKAMALRTAILYSGSQVGNAFGGLFALAILTLDGTNGLSGWRWLFIVEGAMTVGLGLIFMLWMPNTPRNIKWLDEREKAQLQYRLEVDRASKDATDELGVGKAFWLALSDPKTWLLCLVLQMNYIAASVTNFFPIVVGGLGFSRTVTLAITAPPYLLCVVAITINGWHSDKKQERTLHIICPFLVTIIANVIAVSTTNTAARYTAMMLLPGSFYSASIVVLSWISSSITGPHVKRAIVYALINSICNTPNIWTSYLYSDQPRYILAFSVDLAASVGVVLAAALTFWYLRRQNRRIERGEDLGINGPTRVQIEAGFKYQL